MKRLTSPAFLISLAALFLALGGGAAWAGGLFSGRQIVNHSIPEKKLTAKAVEALRTRRPAGSRGPKGAAGATGPRGAKGATGPQGAQGPGAISLNEGGVPLTGPVGQVLKTVHGVDVLNFCLSNDVVISLAAHQDGDTVFASGDMAIDRTLSPVQSSSGVFADGKSKANIDVIAWSRSDGTQSRFDLGGFHGGGGWSRRVPERRARMSAWSNGGRSSSPSRGSAVSSIRPSRRAAQVTARTSR